jgi:putative FmdB family regulatory protein
MPLYEFRCLSCGEVIEEFRFISSFNDPPPICSSCSGPTERIMSSTHVKIPGEFMDNLNVGKSIKKKNERLKKDHADDPGIRRNIAAHANN